MTQWGQAPLNSEGRVGMKFRCKITGEDGNTVYTNVVTAEKKNEIIIKNQPQDVKGEIEKN